MLVASLGLFYAGARGLDSTLDWGATEEATDRIPSPDGRRVASVVELNGALSGTGYSVRVEGKEAAMAYKAEREDGREGVAVRWLDAQTVEVSFRHARFVREGKIPGLKVVVKGSVDAD